MTKGKLESIGLGRGHREGEKREGSRCPLEAGGGGAERAREGREEGGQQHEAESRGSGREQRKIRRARPQPHLG
jgi:hypothetical protein